MLEVSNGHATITCEECGTVEQFHSHSFSEASKYAKSYGWSTWNEAKSGSPIWCNYCPECSKDRKRLYAKEKRREETSF